MEKSAIVKKALPVILKKVAPEIAEVNKAEILETIKTCNCKDQIVVVDAITQTVPALTDYSGTVLKTLSETIQVVEESSSKNYDLVVQAVLNDELATMQEKVEYVMKLEDNRTDNFVKRAKVYTQSAVAIGATLAVPIVATVAKSIVHDMRKNPLPLGYFFLRKK